MVLYGAKNSLPNAILAVFSLHGPLTHHFMAQFTPIGVLVVLACQYKTI